MKEFPIDGFQSALWFDTAVPAPATDPLNEALTTDVVIIGAGITGLNAAIELAHNATNVVVLEAGVVGGGASGRNGGQVNVGLNLSPDALRTHYGEAAAEPLLAAMVRTPQTVFDRIAQFNMACDAEQTGWIQGAVTPRRLTEQQHQATEYARLGLPVEELDRATIARRTGSGRYLGGSFIKTCGSIQPLSYTRELARVALNAGVKIYTHSAVRTLKRGADHSGWIVSTGVGQVSAEQVLVCTNGYTDSTVSGLRQKVVPARSIQVATEPLSGSLQEKILPHRSTLVDKRRMVLYGRYDRDGRLTMGDHGPMRDQFCLNDFTDLKNRAIEVFPELEGVRWDYHWGGRLAMTKDHLPFLFAPTVDLSIGMGYNGRGVGKGSMMGLAMASRILQRDVEHAFMPVTTPDEYVLHAFHEIGATMIIQWDMLMDRLEESRA